MKNKMKKIAFYLLAVILGGCVPSLHPLFTENELIFDANLVGIWSMADSNETWEFKQGDKGNYDFTYIENNGKIGRFDAGLGRLDNTMFLDIYPKELNISENDFYKGHFVPAHTFMIIKYTKDSLDLRAMNPDKLENFLKTEPNSIKYERPARQGIIVLTASTKELQEFILKYGIDEKYQLFGEANKMRRVSINKAEDANKP